MIQRTTERKRVGKGLYRDAGETQHEGLLLHGRNVFVSFELRSDIDRKGWPIHRRGEEDPTQPPLVRPLDFEKNIRLSCITSKLHPHIVMKNKKVVSNVLLAISSATMINRSSHVYYEFNYVPRWFLILCKRCKMPYRTVCRSTRLTLHVR